MTYLPIGNRNTLITEIQVTILFFTCLFSSGTASFLPQDEIDCAGHDDEHCKPSEIASSIDLVLKSGFKNRSYKRAYDHKNKYLSYLKQVRAYPSRYVNRYIGHRMKMGSRYNGFSDLRHVLTLQFSRH